MRPLLIALILCLATPANAENRAYPLGTLISAKPLNGAASTLTFVVGPKLGSTQQKLSSYSYLAVEVTYTKANGGAVIATCTVGGTATTADKTPQVCTGAGTCVLTDSGILSKTMSVSTNYAFRLGTRGYPVVQCIFSLAGAAAGDIVTVVGTLTD